MDDDLDDLLLQVAGRSEEPAPRPRPKSAGKKRSRPAVSESDEDAGAEGPGDSGEAEDDDEEGAYRPPARKAARTPLKKRSVAKVCACGY